ncbi:hemerythrin domain-containing protein [Mycolicibacterium goodii]|uniref:Hemerythrin domain-containing protein n=1 Tax=Mycolicibacterium goodii TaxID=134601 RepID=A0ABS6HJ23_MYCGD|nr:hemerythrin domain-containing protein [Mycolicibacterium goodii]MBU8822673.1 hemerythrin domain-containing protein [Mycolicibacterium goodii]MBU8835054.1 hemerythrin domain-containing protein [Mycolicibacterium goodii]
MPKTFVQSTEDVVKFLTDQHNLIKDLFEEVFSASSDEAREAAFVELRQLLAVHETAEEMVVHPRARAVVADGEAIVEARLQEEHAAKEQLSKLESLDISSKEFITELEKFRDAVIDHADHEEREEFSELSREIDAAGLERMAKAVQAAEAIAPTRPHPGVESAKLNFAVGPFASMLDRARDLIGSALK